MKSEERVRYYSSFDEDFEKTKNQDYVLPDDYVWVRRGARNRILSAAVYGIALIISGLWCRIFLRMRIHGRDVIRSYGEGGFIYSNHTQPVGDVFMPAHAAGKRIRTVVSPSNYGIPVIGKLLPALGALPVPKEIKRLKLLEAAIADYTNEGNMVVIYPEEHVWEYYNGIRPFSESAFSYPIKMKKASFSLTAVYKKSKYRKRPVLHLYADGPFYPDDSLPLRERRVELCRRIRAKMEERCTDGNCEYIKYVYNGE